MTGMEAVFMLWVLEGGRSIGLNVLHFCITSMKKIAVQGDIEVKRLSKCINFEVSSCSIWQTVKTVVDGVSSRPLGA